MWNPAPARPVGSVRIGLGALRERPGRSIAPEMCWGSGTCERPAAGGLRRPRGGQRWLEVRREERSRWSLKDDLLVLIGTRSPQSHRHLNHPRGDDAPDGGACNEVPPAPNCWGPAGYFWEAWLQDFVGHASLRRARAGVGLALQAAQPSLARGRMVPPRWQQHVADSFFPGCCRVKDAATCPVTAFGRVTLLPPKTG